MLGKLGNALKKGFDKIAGAVFLDKKTIEIIVKDLQRALIQADVNIHLVKELGDKIKKRIESMQKVSKDQAKIVELKLKELDYYKKSKKMLEKLKKGSTTGYDYRHYLDIINERLGLIKDGEKKLMKVAQVKKDLLFQ